MYVYVNMHIHIGNDLSKRMQYADELNPDIYLENINIRPAEVT